MTWERSVLGRVAVVLVAVVAGCTAAPTTGTGATVVGQPITAAQAEVLASVLSKNFEAGGATFTAAVPLGGRAAFNLDGRVDYAKGIGQATLRTVDATGVAGPPTDVVWTAEALAEQIPGIAEAMAAKGRSGVSYVSRPLTTATAKDVVLALLLKTANAQRENPALLQQGTGKGESTFLRADTVRGRAVDVFHFGEKTTYWVAQDDGVLQRFEAILAIAPSGPTVIDFVDHKAVDIPGPQTSQVVPASEIADILAALAVPKVVPAPPTT